MDNCNICALVVTYNRKNYLKKLLDGLMIQSRPLDAILIYYNNSTDNTNLMLIELGLIDDDQFERVNKKTINNIIIMYYRSSINEGGSGGFHEGIKIVSEMGFVYIWCMDDDVFPDKCCLEELTKHISSDAEICLPTRTDENFEDYAVTYVNMSNPFKYNIKRRKRRVYNKDILGDVIEVGDMPFEGPLISNCLVKEIGLPKKDLFIIFDDSEYAYRAKEKTKMLYCKKAILHKQIIPVRNPAHLMGWKEYYGWRNQIWFDRTYGKNIVVKIGRPIIQVLDLYLRAILRCKWSNFKVIHRAYKDGINDNLGITVKPGTPGKLF